MSETSHFTLEETEIQRTDRCTGDHWLFERDRTTRLNDHKALGRKCEILPNDLNTKKEKRLEDFD
jgi:hypothetical protein